MVGGASDLELALDDSTAKASAQFQKYATRLRRNLRAKVSADARKLAFTDVVLRDWQEDALARLDECEPNFFPVQLEFVPSLVGSSFQEFGLFDMHSYP